MLEPNSRQCGICFTAAVIQPVLLVVLWDWADRSRSTWPILMGLQLGTFVALGGGVGASLGKMWIGIIAGFILPIVLVFWFELIPC